jgi:hypothetical protein
MNKKTKVFSKFTIFTFQQAHCNKFHPDTKTDLKKFRNIS